MYIYIYIGYFDFNKRIIIEPVLRHLGMLVAPWFDRDCQETNQYNGMDRYKIYFIAQLVVNSPYSMFGQELATLYEKIKIQQSTLQKGEIQCPC